jgi:hypothetical protein
MEKMLQGMRTHIGAVSFLPPRVSLVFRTHCEDYVRTQIRMAVHDCVASHLCILTTESL